MFSSKDIFLGKGGATGYQISRSVRLRASASATFSRTPASASNQKTWTWSGWVKRGNISAMQTIFGAFDSSTSNFVDFGLYTPGSSVPAFWCRRYNNGAGTNTWVMESTSLYRDLSAWYHVVFHLNCTSSPTFRAWINGVELTAWTQNTPPTNSNWEVNGTNAHYIGRNPSAANQYYDGYLTEINFIDGQALTPSSFGATSTTTGVWGPAAYTGTYGTNGYYLNFSDNSGATATTIGKDSSGNGNNWTPNNISVTAGVTYDSMVDTPTPYGSDSGVGGEVRGNYAVLSPIVPTGANVFINGNLTINAGGTYCNGLSTIPLDSGKYYAECVVTTHSAEAWGVWLNTSTAAVNSGSGTTSGFYGIYSSGATKVTAGSAGTTNAAAVPANGDIVQVAWSNGSLWLGKNNTWYDSSFGTTGNPSTGANPMFTGLAANGTFSICFAIGNSTSVMNANFGQRAFSYTAPSGYKALCTQNLSTPTIANGASYMDILLYAGDSSTSRNVTGLSFQPDFSWFKNRSSASYGNELYNSVMGAGAANALGSNNTNAAGGGSETVYGYMSAFLSNGVTVNKGSTDAGYVNQSGSNYVAWNWKAGGSSSSNTSGSITSTVSVNQTAGFSVVTYTGSGSSATVGHGLGVAPSMIIVKNRSSASYGWFVWQTSFGTAGNTDYINLNLSDAKGSGGAVSMWNNTVPTSSVFSIGTYAGVNNNTNNFVAYCWSEIAGFSKFGSYTGNGSTDGPFVYTGFRPRWVMIKRTDSTSDWYIWDTSRDTYNVEAATLLADTSGAETSATSIDDLSNGFKCRSATVVNASGGTYVYACFAENSFKYSLAR
jgi:hypothetical protein